MKESFLHYVWQHQYYQLAGLKTTDNRQVVVRFPGVYNQNSGPDFLHARIRIDDMEWTGAIEIHVNASDYQCHGHQRDPAYNQVMLHVVWRNNQAIHRKDGTLIPAIELHNRINTDLLNRYHVIMQGMHRIPCHTGLKKISKDYTERMIGQSGVERLSVKVLRVEKIYRETNGDWNETAYRMLASNFGMKVNAELFLRLAELLPLRILRRYINSLPDLEALLFGTSGLLKGLAVEDLYVNELMDRFAHLARKFDLHTGVEAWLWKFHRMRPGNFPTIRLAQLAALLQKSDGIFSRLVDLTDIRSATAWMKVDPSPYWKHHYDFGKSVKGSYGNIGNDLIVHLMINVSAPLVAAYSRRSGSAEQLTQAVDMLKKLPAEANKLIRAWESVGVKPVNAFESQGLIHQVQHHCHARNCLNCVVGTRILEC
jgi:hypothetical protein